MKHTECKDCKWSNGDCGHHFKMDGLTNFDIAAEWACDQFGDCGFFTPKEKRNAYKEAGLSDGIRANELCNDLNTVLGRYGLRLFALIADSNYNSAGDADIVAVIQTIPYLNELPHLDSSITG